MIKANHSKWADSLLTFYLNFLFKKHFSSISLLGTRPVFDQNMPILLTANHSTWWDGFFVHFVNKQIFKKTSYLMMLEEQLAINRFFTKVGVYSVNPTSPKDVYKSLSYTIDLLKDSNNLVGIFPQGELLPWNRRPLGFKRGLDFIEQKIENSFQLLPMGVKIIFEKEQRPAVLFNFGEVQLIEKNSGFQITEYEKLSTDLLDKLDNYPSEKRTLIFSGKKSINISFAELTGKQQ